jgi:hypothetical protein
LSSQPELIEKKPQKKQKKKRRKRGKIRKKRKKREVASREKNSLVEDRPKFVLTNNISQ